jgi:DNA mismatch repair protein MutL
MPRIRVLSPEMISRIAAGECVERPASVVKELVENALDAGAGRVEVVIADGGRELIQIKDDGCGMEPDDLRLAVQQHATSKLLDDEDLFAIHTMGFRGEALASIAAVSRLEIVSRTAQSEVGHQLRVNASQASDLKPVNAPPGTRIEVRDLFFNVPARRKFLRTNATEMGHITEQFARIALAHPQIGFSLRSDKRKFHDLEAVATPRERIRSLYGAELADVLLDVQREGDDVSISGLVAPPAESRGSGKWEYVFVNGRYVRDRFVSHAIKEAYRSLIDPRRYPVAFLFITVDPEAIDVNVHPMKTELRWRDSNYVHAQVLAALRELFLTRKVDHDLKSPTPDYGYRERVRSALVDFFTSAKPNPSRPSQTTTAPQPNPSRPASAHESVESTPASPKLDESASDPPAAPAEPAPYQRSAARAAGKPEPQSAKPLMALPLNEAPRARAIQIHDSYLIVETDAGLMIIDQHALHERILYEQLGERVKQRRLESQRSLLPEVLRVPADRMEVLENHAELLDQIGIELTPVGPQSIAIQSFPTLLLERRVPQQAFVRDLLDILGEQGTRPDADTLVHTVLDMMACKAAVKAGDPLTAEEIDALLAQRDRAERSSHCPHGRPTTLHLTLMDLEKQFHRR